MTATSRTSKHRERDQHPITLGIDVGGTGLKASVLDAEGRKLVDRVREKTPYPCPPRVLVKALDKLTFELAPWDRVSVGFPGIVRAGRILTAPNLSTVGGPGTKLDQNLVEKWAGFSLAAELEGRLGKPVRILNDADMHGLAVISGEGLEFVLTLGTGLGAALFMDGDLAPHIELALLPFQGDETYQDRLGNAARRKIGNKAWTKRVQKAVDTFETLLQFDRLFVGGGNAKHLTVDLGHRVQVIDNKAGILGGLKLWEIDIF
jgi:polyphosphate glucokinase